MRLSKIATFCSLLLPAFSTPVPTNEERQVTTTGNTVQWTGRLKMTNTLYTILGANGLDVARGFAEAINEYLFTRDDGWLTAPTQTGAFYNVGSVGPTSQVDITCQWVFGTAADAQAYYREVALFITQGVNNGAVGTKRDIETQFYADEPIDPASVSLIYTDGLLAEAGPLETRNACTKSLGSVGIATGVKATRNFASISC